MNQPRAAGTSGKALPRAKAIAGNLHGCQRTDRMMYYERHEPFYRDAIARAGMTVVKTVGADFPPVAAGLTIGGHTWYAILAESGVEIHTDPENRYVDIYVYFCNFTADNRAKAERLGRELAAYYEADQELIEWHPIIRGPQTADNDNDG